MEELDMSRLRRVRHGRRQTRRLPLVCGAGAAALRTSGSRRRDTPESAQRARAAVARILLGSAPSAAGSAGRNAARALPDLRRGPGPLRRRRSRNERAGSEAGAGRDTVWVVPSAAGRAGRSAARPLPDLGAGAGAFAPEAKPEAKEPEAEPAQGADTSFGSAPSAAGRVGRKPPSAARSAARGPGLAPEAKPEKRAEAEPATLALHHLQIWCSRRSAA